MDWINQIEGEKLCQELCVNLLLNIWDKTDLKYMSGSRYVSLAGPPPVSFACLLASLAKCLGTPKGWNGWHLKYRCLAKASLSQLGEKRRHTSKHASRFAWTSLSQMVRRSFVSKVTRHPCSMSAVNTCSLMMLSGSSISSKDDWHEQATLWMTTSS